MTKEVGANAPNPNATTIIYRYLLSGLHLIDYYAFHAAQIGSYPHITLDTLGRTAFVSCYVNYNGATMTVAALDLGTHITLDQYHPYKTNYESYYYQDAFSYNGYVYIGRDTVGTGYDILRLPWNNLNSTAADVPFPEAVVISGVYNNILYVNSDTKVYSINLSSFSSYTTYAINKTLVKAKIQGRYMYITFKGNSTTNSAELRRYDLTSGLNVNSFASTKYGKCNEASGGNCLLHVYPDATHAETDVAMTYQPKGTGSMQLVKLNSNTFTITSGNHTFSNTGSNSTVQPPFFISAGSYLVYATTDEQVCSYNINTAVKTCLTSFPEPAGSRRFANDASECSVPRNCRCGFEKVAGTACKRCRTNCNRLIRISA
jgi:hypothetical protein